VAIISQGIRNGVLLDCNSDDVANDQQTKDQPCPEVVVFVFCDMVFHLANFVRVFCFVTAALIIAISV